MPRALRETSVGGADTGVAWPARAVAWYAVTVLMAAYTLSYIDRTILSLLVRPIKADLGLTDTQFSLLQGFAFACLYAVLGLPMGALADRVRRKNLIAGGIGIWSGMTTLCGLAQSFGFLFAARVGVGIGEAALGPAAYSMIADSFAPQQRGRALGVYSMGVYLGAGLAIIIGGLVVAAVSQTPWLTVPLMGRVHAWQVVFFVVGLPGLAVALWVLTVLEPVRRGQMPVSSSENGVSGFRAAARFMFSHRRFFICHFVGVGLLTLLFNAISSWVPAYLQRRYGFGPRDVALSYGPILLVAGALGIFCGGWLADSLRKRGYVDAEMRTVVLSALLVWPFAALATVTSSVATSLVLLAPLFFFSSFAFAAAIAALQMVTPSRLRGRVAAVYLLIVNLTGIGLGGTATALVTDYVMHDDRRVGAAMALVAGISAPIAALVLFRGLKYYRAAIAAVAEAGVDPLPVAMHVRPLEPGE